MPHAMVVEVAGAGHLSPMEQPESVNAAMETFLFHLKTLGVVTEKGEGARG